MNVLKSMPWSSRACFALAGLLLGGIVVWRIDAPVIKRLRAEVARLATSQVVEPPSWWFRLMGARRDTVTLTQYRTDPALTLEVSELRRKWQAAEERASVWEWLFHQRDTLPGNIGVVLDSTVADSLNSSWAFKRLEYRNGKVEYLAFLTPAIVKAGRLDLRGSRRWSVLGTPRGVVYDRTRRFLGADWGAFASAQFSSLPEQFQPGLAVRAGLYGERGPVEWSAGWHQQAAPVALGRVFGEVKLKWRW